MFLGYIQRDNSCPMRMKFIFENLRHKPEKLYLACRLIFVEGSFQKSLRGKQNEKVVYNERPETLVQNWRQVRNAGARCTGSMRQVPGARCEVLGVRCQVSGARCQTSGVRCQVPDARDQVSLNQIFANFYL